MQLDDDAIVPVQWLPRLFGVPSRTIRRWMQRDSVARFPHPFIHERTMGPPLLAVRWGDIPQPSDETTRWQRKCDVR